MAPHGPLLVGFHDQVAAGPRRAQEHESRISIRSVITRRGRLIDIAADKPRGAGQAPALMADRGQFDVRSRGGVPDKFILSAIDGVRAFRCFQNDAEGTAH